MTKPCVLIADDDKEIVDLIADSLEDEGFATVKAYSGQVTSSSSSSAIHARDAITKTEPS
ncbi:hypothetical protein ABD76_21390 [Paenibacillus dendritiformis]|uniref:hypothetical protein n=1 Tax=Paenibacillus dendritiformis TaxID=130049 RepID=UPI001F54F150|nr:hypothetical protein [Paenibacillus dendritiformis]MBG9794886.1 hypothetical protein [Paenibacillus dendritiformis]